MILREALLSAQKKLKGKGITSASLDAEVLLLETINRSRVDTVDKSWLYLNLERYILSKKETDIFEIFIRRRSKNEPVAYITNRKDFYGMNFFVDKNVLIPRVETEIIVDKVLEILKLSKKHFTLLDVGTGSGCIAISILEAARISDLDIDISEILVNDISKAAIRIAKKNAKRYELSSRINFLNCDLEKAILKIKNEKDIIITANLPYISTKDYKSLQSNVKKYEPKIALTTKDYGLYHIKRLLDIFAKISHDFCSFHILLEADPRQMRLIESFARKTMKDVSTEIIKDLRGKKRIIVIHKR